MKINKRKLAIFDIDGTVFRSSLLIETTEALIQSGVFSNQARKEYLANYKKWLNRRGSYENYVDAVVKAFIKNIKGVSRRDFLKVVKKTIAFHQGRIYLYTRDLIRFLKKEKYYLLAISNSPKIIVEEFCRRLGFNKVYGQMYEFDKKNKFTGRILFPELISNKAKILERAVKKNNFNFKKSIGVGDTESDIAFLKMVEKPICFNPNQKLYCYAKQQGWQITVERKDVIYHL